MYNHNGTEVMEAVSNDHRIQSVLGRLETIIDNENEKIGKDPKFDLKVSNAHKSRCLYEPVRVSSPQPLRRRELALRLIQSR